MLEKKINAVTCTCTCTTAVQAEVYNCIEPAYVRLKQLALTM